jgi:SAM-dependent methyltransferase
MNVAPMSPDQRTADAFATSWNHLPPGSVYTREQFADWLAPLGRSDIEGKRVLELGCGNGSLLVHLAQWLPGFLEGVDLGDSVRSASANMAQTGFQRWRVTRADMTKFESDGYDVVLCIGVLHHLESPKGGLDAVLRNVGKGGRFHCWVYAKEGNGFVMRVVEPIRKVASRLPWWVTKYFIATPLVSPYFVYAKLLRHLGDRQMAERLPLGAYSLWIGQRDFRFFQHVAFDQLVTPRTCYIARGTIEQWLDSYAQVDRSSTYIVQRNGNSWKFGGVVR